MKKYREYMREGITLSKACIKSNGIFKYYIYYFVHLFFTLIFFLEPYAGLSKYELKNQIKKNKAITLSTMYRGVDKRGYKKLFTANILKFGIILGAILAISALGGILYLIGYGVAYASGLNILTALYYVIPIGVAIIVLILMIPFIQAPNSYIVNNYNKLSVTSVLYNSFHAYRDGGKLTMFLFILTNYISRLLYIALAGAISYFVGVAINGTLGFGIMFILIAAFTILYIFGAPYISLIHLMAKTLFFDDLIYDRYNEDLIHESPNEDIRRIKISKNNKQKSLKLLFNDSNSYMESESYINSLNKIKEEKTEEDELLDNIPEKDDNDNAIKMDKPKEDTQIIDEKNEDVEALDNNQEEIVEEKEEEENTLDSSEDQEDVIEEAQEPQEEAQEEIIEEEPVQDEPQEVQEPEDVIDEAQEEQYQEENQDEVIEETQEDEAQENTEDHQDEEFEMPQVEDEEINEEKEEPAQENTEDHQDEEFEMPQVEDEEINEEKEENNDEDDIDSLLDSIPEKEKE